LENFVKEIRIEAFNTIRDMPNEEREIVMVRVFQNGLIDKISSESVKILNPKTLNDAFNLVKKSLKNDNKLIVDSVLQYQHHDNKNNEKLDNTKLSNYLMRLDMIESKLNKILYFLQKSSERRNYSKNYVPTDNKNGRDYRLHNQSQIIKCFNCGESGHMSRNCMTPLKCFGCKGANHIQ
jgi:hypothetical protein